MTKMTERKQENAEKKPTQAIPSDGLKGAPDGVNSSAAFSKTPPGDGGPYPNPHTGKSDERKKDGFGGHGGQTVIGYHGTGQLGEEKTRPGGNPNSATRSG